MILVPKGGDDVFKTHDEEKILVRLEIHYINLNKLKFLYIILIYMKNNILSKHRRESTKL